MEETSELTGRRFGKFLELRSVRKRANENWWKKPIGFHHNIEPICVVVKPRHSGNGFGLWIGNRGDNAVESLACTFAILSVIYVLSG